MKSLFDNPKAFSPFFDDVVAVEGVRHGGIRVAGTFRGCVLDQGFCDPLSDGSSGSDKRRIVVSFLVGGDSWPADGTRPQAGDRITVADGTVYAVSEVRMPGGQMFECDARQA